MPETIERNALGELAHEVDLLRSGTHETHVPLEDVPQLRDLVESRHTEKGSTANETWIAVRGELGSVPFRVDMHGSELEHDERRAAVTRPLLREDRRSG